MTSCRLLKPSLLRTSGGANILPHLLSLDYINQLNLEEQQKSSRSVTTGRTESEAQSIPSSRSTSSKISSVSTKSFKSTSTTARLLSEADMKIKELEKTLKQEQQGRLEVQKEVERLRSLMVPSFFQFCINFLI